jgi:Tfp pilus assembly protein PilF
MFCPAHRAEPRALAQLHQAPLMTRRTLLGCSAIFLVACLVYANSLGGAFVSDDRPLVLDHPYTKHLRDFPAIFTAGHYAGNGGYRPLTTASFALNYQLGTTNPLGYHLVNVLLHALVSMLVYLLCARIFRSETAALIAAFIFAVHPIHTEAVAWISGRAELWAAFFALLSWLFYLRSNESTILRREDFVASLALFFAALLSKENALVLPLLIAAGDLFLAREKRKQVAKFKSYAAFVAVIAFYFAFRWTLYQHAIIRAADRISYYDNPLASVEASARIVTALKILGQYFLLLAWPRHLLADYSFNTVPIVRHLADVGVGLTLGLILVLGEISLVSFLRRGRIWLPIAIAVIAIAPTANLFSPVGTIKAERLLYLPSVGFCLALGLIWADLIGRWKKREALRISANVILVLGMISLGLRTLIRNEDWRSEWSLWSATARNAPQNFRAQMMLASESLRAGAIETAIEGNRRALAIEPASEDALLNLGVSLVQAGQIAEATQLFERAVLDHPHSASFRLNLGLTYAARGDILSAEENFRQAIELNPASAIGYLNHGLALSRMEKKEEALENYRRAFELKPDYAEAWNAFGALSLKLGRKDDARQALTRALALRPDYRDAINNLQLLDNPLP